MHGCWTFCYRSNKVWVGKGKCFLVVPFYNLQVYLSFGLVVSHTKKIKNITPQSQKPTATPLLPQPNTVFLKTSWKTQGWIYCILNQEWVWSLTSRKNWICTYFMYLKVKIQEAKAIPIQASGLCSKISILATFQTIKHLCGKWMTNSVSTNDC